MHLACPAAAIGPLLRSFSPARSREPAAHHRRGGPRGRRHRDATNHYAEPGTPLHRRRQRRGGRAGGGEELQHEDVDGRKDEEAKGTTSSRCRSICNPDVNLAATPAHPPHQAPRAHRAGAAHHGRSPPTSPHGKPCRTKPFPFPICCPVRPQTDETIASPPSPTFCPALRAAGAAAGDPVAATLRAGVAVRAAAMALP